MKSTFQVIVNKPDKDMTNFDRPFMNNKKFRRGQCKTEIPKFSVKQFLVPFNSPVGTNYKSDIG